MTQKRNQIRAATTLVVITFIMPAISSSAWAQTQSASPSLSWRDGLDARLGYWSGAVGLNYLNGTQSLSSPTAGESKSSNSLMRETLRIANSDFFLLNPRLFKGNLALDLALDQDKSGDGAGSTANRGSVIGYAVDAEFLNEKPLTASVFANRSQNTSLQPFGGRMVGVNENRGATLNLRQDSILSDWGYPWVEANLGIRQAHNRSTTTSFGRSLSTDEKSRTIDLSASKGFQTADLGLNYRVNDMSNQAFKEGNFQSRAAGLNYSLDFGPVLNRRLDSTFNYLARNGAAGSTTFTNSEHLHIDHYQNLATDYRYGFARLKFGGISTTEQNGAFSVSHQLYKNLNTSAGLNGSRSTVPQGSSTFLGGNLGEAYRHSLPGKGDLSMNWSGSYQVANNNLSASSISVLEEAHNAPTPFGAGVGFLLSHNFAQATSIVVTNVRGGGRIPTSVGVDYDILNQNNQITIVPLAGSLLILPGDPLVVSYAYQVDAGLKYVSKASGYGMAVDYRWISIAYRHQASSQTPSSATSSLFLQSTQQNSLQINLQGTLLKLPATAGLDIGNFESNTSAYQRSRLTSSLIWEIQSNTRMIFAMNASESKYTVPIQRKNSTRSARSSINWFSVDGWNNTASVDWSTNKDSATPVETLVQAIAQSSITLGLLSLNASVALGEWSRYGSKSTNRSFNIGIVREFR
jgi:hypothetical protein